MCRRPRSALAVNQVCREKNKVMLNSGTGTSDLTGKQCSPNTIHWTYDTYMLAKSTGGATVKQGGDTWFFITADYVFGQTLERDTAALVQKAGGKVLGRCEVSVPGDDGFLIDAGASAGVEARRCWGCAMPAATPPTASSRRRNSA